MRTHLFELTEDLARAIRATKAGKQVVLTEKGVPVAIIEPIRPASKEEARAIRDMIKAGDLQPTRKSGPIREWRWKAQSRRAA